ncbi:MAG TPA: VOC family protein [Opitutaceae bacterium]
MSIKIKEVAFICHTVADVPRARDFYEKLLGLTPTMNMEFAPGIWWIEYEMAGVALAVTNSQPPTGAGGASLALEVENLDEAHASVKAAGIPLAFDKMDFPPCRIFGVASPDGYSVMFHQRKA